ncbi:MAG: ABC transporter substrate-binding protein [Pseudomonadota bacterium]
MRISKNNRTSVAGPSLDRRRFLGASSASVAAGLAAGAGGLWPETSWAQAPRRGGTLRLGVSGTSSTDTLDPAAITGAMVGALIGQVRNGPLEISGTGELVGELVESWEAASTGAEKWLLRLRPGVEFHSGKTFGPEDFLYTMGLHLGDDSASPLKTVFSSITDLSRDGDMNIMVTLASGNADFPVLLSDPRLQIVQDGDTDFDSGNGTGGYILQEWEKGVRSFATRNPNYWKDDHANFDEVETLGINDANARTSGLRAGDLDVINNVERSTARRLEALSGIELVVQNGYKHYTLPMRADVAPFNDNDVRLAVKYAMNREAMLETILFGFGEVGNDHPIPGSLPDAATADELPQRAFDPEKAKFHLKKAGVDSLQIQLNSSEAAFTGAVDGAVLLAESAREAGIDIEVVRQPSDGYWSDVWRKEPWVMSYWSGRPTADWIFSEGYVSTASYNDAFWTNGRFDKLLVEARTELDQARRRELYVEMQRIVSNDGGQVIPVFAADVLAKSDKLAHGSVAVNWDMDGYKLADRWWFSE